MKSKLEEDKFKEKLVRFLVLHSDDISNCITSQQLNLQYKLDFVKTEG